MDENGTGVIPGLATELNGKPWVDMTTDERLTWIAARVEQITMWQVEANAMVANLMQAVNEIKADPSSLLMGMLGG